ncbi:MAG: hypothetical protein EAZ84_09910 [Verrucomicrobia bacterium]|nr:MAG: hypothetical protein EAZ84_09910 [Verrucomicrobiota bacterium]
MANPNYPGQNQGAGDVRALNLDLFSGEIIGAFETATVFRDKHQSKTLAKGKSFRFPAIWRAGGGYHTPGTELLGRRINHTEILVTPDDKLVSDVFLPDIEEIINHFDVRQPYMKEMGEFLARHYDANVLRTILLASRGGALFTGDQGGGAVVNASLATDGNALIDAISAAKQSMDEKDVPVNSMPVYAAFRPAQWYLMARTDRNLNRNTNGSDGEVSYKSMKLTTIDDIQVLKTNIANDVYLTDNRAAPYSTAGNEKFIPTNYRGSFGATVGTVWTPMAACSALVEDVKFQIEDQPRKQGTLMIAALTVGTRTLRSKCAVELRTGAIPA